MVENLSHKLLFDFVKSIFSASVEIKLFSYVHHYDQIPKKIPKKITLKEQGLYSGPQCQRVQ